MMKKIQEKNEQISLSFSCDGLNRFPSDNIHFNFFSLAAKRNQVHQLCTIIV